MTPEEKRGYNKGYEAGRRRKIREDVRAKKQEFLDRAFLAALPAMVAVEKWTTNGKPVVNLSDRIDLAWRAALRAWQQRPIA